MTAKTTIDVAGLVITLSDMKQVAVRLDEETLARIDELARRFSEQQPGLMVTRSDVVRMALLAGLAALTSAGEGSAS